MKTTLKIFLTILFNCALVLNAYGDKPPDAKESKKKLSLSADDELARSSQELNKLRAEVSAEKLPLSQELSELEENLAKLRREHENVTRLVDAGNLEITTIKAEMRARQDELTYIGNLLDEYARTLESKINISETQYLGAAIQTAKQATENTSLSMTEKFTQQVALGNASLKRLFEVIGGMRFEGVGVDMQGRVVEGQYAIIGPVALFSAKKGKASGIVIPQSGSTNPLIRPLEGPMQEGIEKVVRKGSGDMPVDPTRGGALNALMHKTDLIEIFHEGGPIMWPLLLAAVLAFGTVVERVMFLLNEQRKRNTQVLDKFFEALAQGDVEHALTVSKSSKFYIMKVLGYALEHKEKSLAGALMYAQEQELKRFRRGIPMLDTVITLAPLLGLLGTVTGMMGSFALIGGELSAPGAITGGIAEALIATAFGLGIAITSLIPFNILNTKVEDAKREIESVATQMELIMHPAPVIMPDPLLPQSVSAQTSSADPSFGG